MEARLTSNTQKDILSADVRRCPVPSLIKQQPNCHGRSSAKQALSDPERMTGCSGVLMLPAKQTLDHAVFCVSLELRAGQVSWRHHELMTNDVRKYKAPQKLT